MPFIAITERAFASLVNEQLDVLQRAVSIQRRMERLVLDERSLGEVVRGLANSIGATMMVLDAGDAARVARLPPRARAALSRDRARVASARAPAFAAALAADAGRAIALPVPSGSRGAPSWLGRAAESDSVADSSASSPTTP